MSAFMAEEQECNAARVDADAQCCADWLEAASAQMADAARTIAHELAESIKEDRLGSSRRDTRYLAGLRFGIEAVVRQAPGFKGHEDGEAVRRGLVFRYLNR